MLALTDEALTLSLVVDVIPAFGDVSSDTDMLSLASRTRHALQADTIAGICADTCARVLS